MTARCELCWEEFESEMDLLRHEATEDDRLYDLSQPAGTPPTRVVGDSE